MPHIVLEYSHNVDAALTSSNVLQKLHKAVIDTGLFSPEAVKARALSYSHIVLTDGAQSFAHVTVSILSGRSLEQCKELGQQVFEVLCAALPKEKKKSVNIHEMEKETYYK